MLTLRPRAPTPPPELLARAWRLRLLLLLLLLLVVVLVVVVEGLCGAEPMMNSVPTVSEELVSTWVKVVGVSERGRWKLYCGR